MRPLRRIPAGSARNNTVLSPPLIRQAEHVTELADVLRAAIAAAAD